MLLSSDATSKALQVVEKIELDTEKIREDIAQTNVQLDKFEQQLVSQVEQLKQALETEQKLASEQKQAMGASLLQSKKTLEDNTSGLNLVNQTLTALSDEFKRLASRLEAGNTKEQERKEAQAEAAQEAHFAQAVQEAQQAKQAALREAGELAEKLETALAELTKLQSKKKYQMGQVVKTAEDLEGILELKPAERTGDMSKFAWAERKLALVGDEVRSLKALTKNAGQATQQLTKDLGEANTQVVVLREKRTHLLTVCQAAYSLILYLLQSFIAQAKIIQKAPALPGEVAPAILSQKLPFPATTSLLDVQEKLEELIQATETHSPGLMVYLEDQIEGYLAGRRSV